MDCIVKFNDESYWEWGDWEEPYIRAVLEHANINAAEVYAEEVDDYEQMKLWVKELDKDSGEYIKKKYYIHFFEECAIQGCLMFAHFLWQVNDCDMTLIDQGIYQIFQRDDDSRYCLLIAEET